MPQVATPQASNPQEALVAKKADVEAKLKARQDATLQRIDEQIAKAKEAGKPTDKLEQKRQRVLERIEKHQERLNKRVEAQKAKLNAAGFKNIRIIEVEDATPAGTVISQTPSGDGVTKYPVSQELVLTVSLGTDMAAD